MPLKTPRIFTIFLFIAGVFSITSVQAAETIPTTLAQCQTAYYQAYSIPAAQQNTAAVQNALKTWCVNKCIDQKVAAYAAERNQTVTEALKTTLTPTYQPVCTAQFSTASGTGNVATNSSAAPTPSECLTDQSIPANYGQCQQAILRQQNEAQRQADAAAEAARQQAAQLAQQNAAAAAQRQRANAALIPVVGQLAGQFGNGSSNSGNGSGGSGSGANNGSGSSGPTSYTDPYGSSTSQPAGTGSGTAVQAAPPAPATVAEANKDIANSAANRGPEAYKDMPEQIRDPAAKADGALNNEATTAKQSPITASAQQGAQTLKGKAEETIANLRTELCNPITTAPADTQVKFGKTLAAFEKFLGRGGNPDTDACNGGGGAPGQTAQNTTPAESTTPSSTPTSDPASTASSSGADQCGDPGPVSDVAKFNAQRTCQCVKAAEAANKWCVESESAQKYRAVMDAAGPVLLGLNAVTRTCGGMNNVSKFVGAGLTAVNAWCVKEKLSCQGKCTTALSQFTAAHTDFGTKSEANYKFDKTQVDTACKKHESERTRYIEAEDTVNAEKESQYIADCNKNAQKVYGLMRKAVAAANQMKTVETNPQTPGSVPGMLAKCSEMQKQVIAMATNIGAIALAAANAKKCEKAMAANGGGAGGGDTPTVAAQEYCSADSTRDTQFCKCQSSPSTQGCAAVLAAGIPTNAPNDPRGVNLQNGGGPSSFAGGGSDGSGSTAGGYRGYSLGADGNATTQSNLGSINSTMGGGGTGKVGGGGDNGGGSGSAAVDSKGGAKAVKPEDKKWSFGSFASSLGGSLGFGGGGNRGGSGDNGSGSSGDRQAQIERKLASDRFAAEVSPSTGADNFTKIKRSYVQKADTFMGP